MAYPKPHLLSLGLSRTLTALVWLAGPLSGTFVQPWVGLHSDRCTHPLGRRKPYIVGGAVCTIFCMLALACTKDVIELAAKLAGLSGRRNAIKTTVKILAVFWVYALNVMIQPLQSGIRAMIVDQCPAHQQVQASAWASRFTSAGSVFTCALGFTYLPGWLPIGNTQFKSLAVVATISLTIPVLMSSFAVLEDRPRLRNFVDVGRTAETPNSRWRLFPSWSHMPSRARHICRIQFVSWMGWFPFLFYTTTQVPVIPFAPRPC